MQAVKPEVVEVLLGFGAGVQIKGGTDLETPLHIASRVTGGESCALMLLRSGAEPNITMENGDTPLHVRLLFIYDNLITLRLYRALDA